MSNKSNIVDKDIIKEIEKEDGDNNKSSVENKGNEKLSVLVKGKEGGNNVDNLQKSLNESNASEINDSQNFSLLVLDDSQSKGNDSLCTEVNNSNVAVQDGKSSKQVVDNNDNKKGKDDSDKLADDSVDSKKIPIEIINNKNLSEMEDVGDSNKTDGVERAISNSSDEVIESTPPEELLRKAQLLSPSGVLKRKSEQVITVPPKIQKVDENTDDKLKKSSSPPDNNTTTPSNTTDNDGKSKETFDEISQALAKVLNDGDDKMDITSDKSKILDKSFDDPKDLENLEKEFENIDGNNVVNKVPSSDESINKDEMNDTLDELQNIPESFVKKNVAKASSRHSIEVVYDKSKDTKMDVIELLDSSHEDNSKIDKSDDSNKSISNGTKILDNSKKTDITYDSFTSERSANINITTLSLTKNEDTIHSDIENDSFMHDDKNAIASSAAAAAAAASAGKTKLIENETTLIVKIKYVLQLDSNNKDIVNKEIVTVSCDASPTSSRKHNSDSSTFGDVSDNKDGSPGSVSSNAPMYSLMSRYSLTSTVSSSSASSSSSNKLSNKDNLLFSYPKTVPKQHVKKSDPDSDDGNEKIKKDWKNSAIILSSVLNYMNSEIINTDLHNGTGNNETSVNEPFKSSTPEVITTVVTDNNSESIVNIDTCKQSTSIITPKSSKKGRVKRTRSTSKSSSNNGLNKSSPVMFTRLSENSIDEKQEANINDSLSTTLKTPNKITSKSSLSLSTSLMTASPSAAGASSSSTPRSLSILRNQTPNYEPSDAYVGKKCFAKWTDDYYPGKVLSKSKGKFKILFLDGKSKSLIESFVIPISNVLPVKLSVYAVEDDKYGSCGVITDVDTTKEDVIYTIDTDEGKKLKVTLKDIFLTEDQVKILKGSIDSVIKGGGSSTDSPVDSPRKTTAAVSTVSTPKAKGRPKGSTKKNLLERASGSGIISIVPTNTTITTPTKATAAKNTLLVSDSSDEKHSDINIPTTDDELLIDIYPDIIGTLNESSKGPTNRIKGKARSKKKDDAELLELLGPIPSEGSTLFKGMTFILTCASIENLDKLKSTNAPSGNDSCSDSAAGSEIETDWILTPFDRERLEAQIKAGGGIIYKEFEDIPAGDYSKVTLITNIPNITKKSLLCLSVGIGPVSHRWIILCCKENQISSICNFSLPIGWSVSAGCYIDMTSKRQKKPFNSIAIAIPKLSFSESSLKFWEKVIVNAGGKVIFLKGPTDAFIEASVIIANGDYPDWVNQKAMEYGHTPVRSTSWLVDSLITGIIID